MPSFAYAWAKLGSSSTACLYSGIDSASIPCARWSSPRVKLCKASRDEVVTCPSGLSKLWMEASDSPNLLRRLAAALPSAVNTCSLLFASPPSRARESAVWQLAASRSITNWLPSLEIDPAISALLPSRWQISLARSDVTRVSGGRFMYFSVSRTFGSGTIFRKGDWSRSTARASLSVPSKTLSPVVLVKSANTILSCSVSLAEWRERQYRPPATKATTRRAAGANIFQYILRGWSVTIG